jgi:hypothetical protein
MHKTEAGEKAKALQKEALELARSAKATRRAANALPDGEEKARELEGQADKLKAEVEALKREAKLEALTVWVMGKIKATKKGSRTYTYWMATWREGRKVRNVYLGSCGKMDEETARLKARELKAAALAIKL